METRLLTTQEAARMLGISPVSLECARCRQSPQTPPFVKFGRSVRYDIRSLEKFIESHTVINGAV